ncbi:MAG: hypothetical protein RR514_06830 [Christensenella sp.]
MTEVILWIAIGAAVLAAVIYVIRQWKKGKCVGCSECNKSGGCAGCPHAKKPRRP